jgi:heme O synthase-like polyprenyltransferase
MAHGSALTELSSSVVQARRFEGSTRFSDYWALTKPEVNFLILVTTFVEFYLASPSDGRFSFVGLFNTLLGTLLVKKSPGPIPQATPEKTVFGPFFCLAHI